MEIFFGAVPVECTCDNSDYFYSEGEYFYYKLTVKSDTVYLEDTLGRMIPIDAETMGAATFAFELAADTLEAVGDLNASIKDAVDDWNAQ